MHLKIKRAKPELKMLHHGYHLNVDATNVVLKAEKNNQSIPVFGYVMQIYPFCKTMCSNNEGFRFFDLG
jgi:hypothetical protein